MPSEKKIAVEAPRFSGFHVTTDQLTLITDRDHPLYDPRVLLPLKPELVASIRARGVLKPLTVYKDGDTLIVLDGRQRYRHTVEANKINVAEGAPAIRIPIIIRKERSVADAYATHVVANEHAQADPVSVRAEKALKLKDFGQAHEEIAAHFGESPSRIQRWLHIAEMAPAVKAAIDAGRISEGEAVKELSGLTHAAQRDALASVVATSPAARRASKPAGKARQPSPISRLRVLHRRGTVGVFTKREAALIGFVFGECSAGDLLAVIPGLADVLKAAK